MVMCLGDIGLQLVDGDVITQKSEPPLDLLFQGAGYSSKRLTISRVLGSVVGVQGESQRRGGSEFIG